MTTYKQNILDIIETAIGNLCQRMVDYATREGIEPTVELEIAFQNIDDQLTSYIEEFDCATRIATVSDPYGGETNKIPFSQLSLEHQVEIIDGLEDDLEFVV